jgi:hypothetical protein
MLRARAGTPADQPGRKTQSEVHGVVYKTKKQLTFIMSKKAAQRHADHMKAEGAPNATKRRQQNQKNDNTINPLHFAFSKAEARS